MPHRNKVLRLRPQRPAATAARAADRSASQMAITVRAQLSLLQGYADIMEGLSPELKKQILQVMAQKTRELGSTLQPFVEQTPAAGPDIGDYGRVRERTRHLWRSIASCWRAFTRACRRLTSTSAAPGKHTANC